jgi:gamma-glutamyltranspeptidase/glutathione hydrolase
MGDHPLGRAVTEPRSFASRFARRPSLPSPTREGPPGDGLGQTARGIGTDTGRIEALRLDSRDRLTPLGEPEAVTIPQSQLLSEDYARECAAKVDDFVKSGRPLAHAVTPRDHTGTIHLSAADRQGNFAALTLTHGNSFGTRVTVNGLGLTLGHGMSRFDPHPEHPNAPGPGKRPLHNMVPTIVTRNGRPVLAAGGRGGRKIRNAMFELLTRFVGLGKPPAAAIAATRL